MQDAHDTDEHLRRHILVYLAVLMVVQSWLIGKNGIYELLDLVLVHFTLLKTVERSII